MSTAQIHAHHPGLTKIIQITSNLVYIDLISFNLLFLEYITAFEQNLLKCQPSVICKDSCFVIGREALTLGIAFGTGFAGKDFFDLVFTDLAAGFFKELF
ncbi:MAG: hypothetical protein OIF58_15480 [Cohaesibacter sp.]|nr:hypothetical protein [Cohaesibacter sp.]